MVKCFRGLPHCRLERRRRAALLLVLTMLFGVASSASGDEKPSRRYALLVGVGSYQQWSSLVNPIPDIRALAAELSGRYGFLTETLENPTLEELVAKLRRYTQIEYGPEDQLLVVFAGHGTYDEVTRIGYLVAADSRNRQRDPNFVSLLSYPWLLSLIDKIRCPHVLLLVDACFAGSLRTGASVARNRGGRVRQFLTSGGVEYVPDGDPGRHTPFMRQLLAGLSSVNKGESLELDALFGAFMQRVDPTPRLGTFGHHDAASGFVFRAIGDNSSAAPPSAPAPRRAASVHAAPPAAAPGPPLRREPRRLADSELKRAVIRVDAYDRARNPEGDFPNQYRVQRRDGWEVVVDLESRLMWQRSGSDRRMSHHEGLAFVTKLNRDRHAGYGDWRMPTIEELASLLEPERMTQGLYLSPHFDAEQESCWSVDRGEGDGAHYYTSFNAGRAVLALGNRTAFIRAVRSE